MEWNGMEWEGRGVEERGVEERRALHAESAPVDVERPNSVARAHAS